MSMLSIGSKYLATSPIFSFLILFDPEFAKQLKDECDTVIDTKFGPWQKMTPRKMVRAECWLQ